MEADQLESSPRAKTHVLHTTVTERASEEDRGGGNEARASERTSERQASQLIKKTQAMPAFTGTGKCSNSAYVGNLLQII